LSILSHREREREGGRERDREIDREIERDRDRQRKRDRERRTKSVYYFLVRVELCVLGGGNLRD
jgi:hypothetical protein